ncbi:MAG: protein kinase [Myxococcota bacterium]
MSGTRADLKTIRELFDGQYRVLHELPWNGLALTYQVESLHGIRAVAILPFECPEGSVVRERFEAEARRLRTLEHPRIVRVLDYGVRHDVPYLELELVEGRTLAEELELGPIGRKRALTLAHEILEALAAVHNLSLRHLDLTPANIILARDAHDHESACVVGAGFRSLIDTARDRSDTGPTGKASGPRGRRYLAPEMIDRRSTDRRADTYSLGAILYRMIADAVPPEPPIVSEFGGNLVLPGDLEPLLRRAVHRDPVERFPSAEEMMEAVGAALRRNRPVSSHPIRAAVEPERRRFPVWIAAAAAVFVAGGGGYVAYSASDSSPPEREVLASDSTEPDTVPETAASEKAAPETAAPETAASQPAASETAPSTSAIGPDDTTEPAGESAHAPEPAPEVGAEETLVVEPAAGVGSPLIVPVEPLFAELPAELAEFHDRILAGDTLSRGELNEIAAYGRAHEADPRPQLLLAQAYLDLRWYSDAIDRYVAAYTIDPAAREHGPMLENLIVLVFNDVLWYDAVDAIDEVYGTEALHAIDAAIAAEPGPAAETRLRRLRARIEGER